VGFAVPDELGDVNVGIMLVRLLIVDGHVTSCVGHKGQLDERDIDLRQ